MGIKNHQNDPKYENISFLETLFKYNETFEGYCFTVEEIRADMTASSALERIKKAIKENKPIEYEDASFFDSAAYFDFYEEEI